MDCEEPQRNAKRQSWHDAGELLRVFKEEGGISTRNWRRYAYRDCPYIKVDVEFQPVGDPENRVNQSTLDKIIKISKPFLEWSIMD